MPARDGRGPMGVGPMTGRGMGRCANVAGARGGQPSGGGRGMMGRGGGRGFRHRYYATGLTGRQRATTTDTAETESAMPPAQEVLWLKQQASVLGKQVDMIKQRLDELQSSSQG